MTRYHLEQMNEVSRVRAHQESSSKKSTDAFVCLKHNGSLNPRAEGAISQNCALDLIDADLEAKRRIFPLARVIFSCNSFPWNAKITDSHTKCETFSLMFDRLWVILFEKFAGSIFSCGRSEVSLQWRPNPALQGGVVLGSKIVHLICPIYRKRPLFYH